MRQIKSNQGRSKPPFADVRLGTKLPDAQRKKVDTAAALSGVFARPLEGPAQAFQDAGILALIRSMAEAQLAAVPALVVLVAKELSVKEREGIARDMWEAAARFSGHRETQEAAFLVVAGPLYGPPLLEWLRLGRAGAGRMDEYLKDAENADRLFCDKERA